MFYLSAVEFRLLNFDRFYHDDFDKGLYDGLSIETSKKMYVIGDTVRFSPRRRLTFMKGVSGVSLQERRGYAL